MTEIVYLTFEQSPDPRSWAMHFAAEVGSFATQSTLTHWFRRAMLAARRDELIELCAMHPCPRCDASRKAVLTSGTEVETFSMSCINCGFTVNGGRADVIRHEWNSQYGGSNGSLQ